MPFSYWLKTFKLSKYKTIHVTAESLFKDKHSKFFGYAFALNDSDEIPAILVALKKKHQQARHFCFAYRIGLGNNEFRANDDGEPSGTAGKPILGQIDSFGLTNVIIVVVRYFGGTKLGVSGLIQAYRAAARLALENATIIVRENHESYLLHCAYKDLPILLDFLKKHNVLIQEKNFTAEPQLTISVAVSEKESLFKKLQDLNLGKIESN